MFEGDETRAPEPEEDETESEASEEEAGAEAPAEGEASEHVVEAGGPYVPEEEEGERPIH